MAPSFFAFLSKRENATTLRKPSDPPSRSRTKSPAGLPPTPSTKSIPSPSIADRSEQFEDSELSLETDYVLADIDSPPFTSATVFPHASSSNSSATNSTTKLRIPFRRKQPSSSKLSTVPPQSPVPPAPPAKEYKFSVDSSLSESPSLLPPPSRSAIFGSYADPHNALSTRSLPQHSHSRHGFQEPSLHYETMSNPDSHSPSVTVTTTAQSKQPTKGGLFSWARPRARTKSKAPPPGPSLNSPPVLTLSPAESFNLRSFRHVTSPAPETPPSSSASSKEPRPRPRPRGDSFASDSSQQRISVAAFREAQARRSAAGSPVPSSSGDADNLASAPVRNRRRSSALATPPSVLPTAASLSRVPLPRNPPTRSSTAPLSFSSTLTVTSSESSDEEESESEEEATLRPSRNRTLTNRSAQSELGHRPSPVSSYSAARSDIGHGLSSGLSSRLSPPPRNTRNSPHLEASGSGSRASSVYSRARASVSTSALVPDGAAKRVSRIPKHSAASRSRSTQPPPRSRSRVSTSSSESSSEPSSSEDAPLASLVPPQRPGSAMSRASGSAPRRPAKPLIDIGQLVGENSPLPPRPSEPSNDASQIPSSQTDSPAGRPRKTSFGIGERLSALASGLSGLQPSRSKSPDSASDSKDEAFTPPEIPLEKPRPSQSPIPSPQSSSSPMLLTKPASTTPLKSKANKPPSALRLKPSNTPKVDTQSLKLDSAVSPPPSSSTSSDAPIPHITPTPIRERQELPAFAVTSRPTSHATNPSVGTLAALDKAIGDADPKTGPGRAAASGIADQSPKQDQQPQRRRQPPQEEPQTTVRVVRSVAQKSSKEEPLPVPRPHSRPRVPPVGVTVSNIHLTPPPSSASSALTKPSALRQVPGNNGAVVPPRKPFVLRDRSPASSAGDSSSSRMPITPRDGSELGVASTGRPGIVHRKRVSVTFLDELGDERETRERDPRRISVGSRSSHGHGHGPPVVASSSDDEDTARDRNREREAEEKRKERRRIEAKAAIELGNVINGPGPIDDDDDDDEVQPMNVPPRMSMARGMGMNPGHHNIPFPTAVGPMGLQGQWGASAAPSFGNQLGNLSMQNLLNGGADPGGMGMGMTTGHGAGMNMNMNMNMANMGMGMGMANMADPRVLVVHQQAMMIAKQTYQLAVAQQAMRDAADEWERGSAISGWGGGGGRSSIGAPSLLGGGMPGLNMNMNMGGGMGGFPGPGASSFPTPGNAGGMGWPGGGAMPGFPGNAARPMYPGNAYAASEIGGGGDRAGPGGWGTSSVYGEAFGAPRDRTSRAPRQSHQMQQQLQQQTSPTSGGGAAMTKREGPRPRTRTAPSSGGNGGAPRAGGAGVMKRPKEGAGGGEGGGYGLVGAVSPPSSWKGPL
ncbi:hypothetical protein BJV74DRAFT_887552 [Russula compacta]|nr:hypothetical protein BJV74DRAFT_887552 [Russula compacta]